MRKDNFDAIIIVAVIVFLIALVLVSPLITIWALNTLFPLLAIPYTIWTWLATFWIVGVPIAAKFKPR
jgi:hypothetical protein